MLQSKLHIWSYSLSKFTGLVLVLHFDLFVLVVCILHLLHPWFQLHDHLTFLHDTITTLAHSHDKI